MHIPTPKTGFLNKEKAEQELRRLIEQPGPREVRPCPNCPLPDVPHFPAQCNASCENASQALSSEPDKYPIEEHVVRIVFELSTLRLLQPCWSCEGHLNGQGELWKLPQVSFYSASELYPKLLAGYLSRLKNSNLLHYPWQVTIADYGQTWGPTYQMEPALNQIDGDVQLALLQSDLLRISEGLAKQLKQEAGLMLVNIRRE